jgi:hypothetical protein
MQLVDAFLEESKSSLVFPVTQEVVPPAVHLTEACWQTFKKYVVAKGCTIKRREATREERRASKDSRKGKLYVISVTVPVNPAELEEKKRKDDAAAKEKRKVAAVTAEKKRLAAEKKAELERALQAKIKEEYAGVVATLEKEGDKENPAAVLKERNTNIKEEQDNNPSPKKRLKITKMTVPTPRIISYAEQVHEQRLRDISDEMHLEKYKEREKILAELDTKMREKEAAAKAKAREYCDSVIVAIKGMASSK